MKTSNTFFIVCLILLFMAGCQGGGGYAPSPQAATEAPQAITTPPAYTMGPGMQQNYGMMQPEEGQMYGQMGMGGGMGGGMMGGGMMEGQGYRGQGPQQQYPGRNDGAGLFAENCAGCHPNGGNTFNPGLPLRGAPQLGSFSSFRSIVREGRGPMPAFSSSRISNSQLRELYRYVRSAFGG
jgi:cytochrome c6